MTTIDLTSWADSTADGPLGPYDPPDQAWQVTPSGGAIAKRAAPNGIQTYRLGPTSTSAGYLTAQVSTAALPAGAVVAVDLTAVSISENAIVFLRTGPAASNARASASWPFPKSSVYVDWQLTLTADGADEGAGTWLVIEAPFGTPSNTIGVMFVTATYPDPEPPPPIEPEPDPEPPPPEPDPEPPVEGRFTSYVEVIGPSPRHEPRAYGVRGGVRVVWSPERGWLCEDDTAQPCLHTEGLPDPAKR